MIKIGSKVIDTNIFLAPLAGCSDLPFRLISREHGAGFCFFEMVDSNSITRNHRKTFSILKTVIEDSPIAGQLLGSDPSVMADAAKRMLDTVKISFLDINCACPVKKAIKKKSGAYLLRDSTRLARILEQTVSSVDVPVTVKLRTGYDKKDAGKIAETAKICQESGASAIFVHGRLAADGYHGEIDYGSIKAIKDNVRIPVFGSGNIFTPELAKKMLDDTGCDGILVARGALGNPWIFSQIEEYIKGSKSNSGIKFSSRKEILKRHLGYVKVHNAGRFHNNTGPMHKIMMWYLKGFPKACSIRQSICRTKNYDEMIELIDTIG